MKKICIVSHILLVSVLCMLFTGTHSYAQITPADYVTTWRTDQPSPYANDQIIIPAVGEYTIYYESIPAGLSGTLPETGIFSGTQTITFPVAGTYRVAMKAAGSDPFHRILQTGGGNQIKLQTIEQWGTTVWSSMLAAYADCRSLTTLPETDMPILSNVSSMYSAFGACAALTGSSNMNDWDVSHVTDMTYMFAHCGNFNQPLNKWNVSNVTSMERMFLSADAFNQPINSWDVSNVTTMAYMFNNNDGFNQPLDNWIVDKVTDMRGMFAYATTFSQPIDNWNVSNVVNMQEMFSGAEAFNQPIGNWNVSNVADMRDMFNSAAAFNQPLDKWTFKAGARMTNMLSLSGLDCANYNTSIMGWAANPATPSGLNIGAFQIPYGPPALSAHDFLLNEKGWNFSGDSYDASCTSVNPISHFVTVWKTTNPGVSGGDQITIPATGTNYDILWEEIGNPSNNGGVTGVSNNYTIQFQTAGTYQVSITPGAGTFSRINFGPNTDHQKILEIRQWGDIAWESMENAYASCYNLSVTATDIPDLSNVSSMQGMFASCLGLPGIPQINNWNVSNVTDMGYLFSNTHFNDPINNWDVSNVTDMSGMFSDTPFNQPIANWIVGNATNMSYMFHKTVTFNQPIGGWDVSKVTNMSYMFAESESFNQPIDDWETGSVVNMRSMFGLSLVFNQPIGSWDVSNVMDMESMFWNTSFNQPIGDWKTGNVTTMSRMFYQATAFNQPIGDWDVGNVLDMQYTFYGASAFNQPIGAWDMGNVITTQFMFSGAGAFNQPVNDWDMSHVADLSFMFYGAVSFNQPVNEWDLSSATSLTAMFFQALSFNQPVNNWDVSNATYLQGVFIFASAFNQPLDKWTLSSATDMTSLLDGTSMDCGNMSLTLKGWAENPATPNNIIFGADGITYGLPAAAHLETLTTAKNWTVTIGSAVVCEVLEVSLISFDAKNTDGTVRLKWATASETDNDYFEVERSADTRHWYSIGRAKGAGTVTSVHNYSLVDSNPLEGNSYYRLKIVDFAGKADYSGIRAVNMNAAPTLSVYPNPASDILLIENYQQVKQIELFNAAGTKLLEHRKLTAQGIDISRFLPGLHTVKIIHTDGTFQTTKVLILR